MRRIKGSKSSSSTEKIQCHIGLYPWNPAFKTTKTNARIWGWQPPACVLTWGGQQLLPFCWAVMVCLAFSRLRPSNKLWCFLSELVFSLCTVNLFPLLTSQSPPLSPSLITEQTSRKVESDRHSFPLPDLLTLFSRKNTQAWSKGDCYPNFRQGNGKFGYFFFC